MYRIFVVLCLILVLCFSQALSQELDIVPVQKVISLDLKEMPLKLVAGEIYKQAGCKIVFDEKWNNLLLNGQYTEVTLEEFFWRSLRKHNISLSHDDKSNVVNLHFFGDKNKGKIDHVSMASANGEAIKEIKMMRESQRAERERWQNDPDSIDPESGMKLVDIKEMRESQRAERERWQNDLNSIDPESGMKLVDIMETREVQRAEQESRQNDPSAIDPESGMKLVDIKEMREANRLERERWQNDPNSIDPESGMKLVDIKRMRGVQRIDQ